jgi:hypothetical protein
MDRIAVAMNVQADADAPILPMGARPRPPLLRRMSLHLPEATPGEERVDDHVNQLVPAS